MGYDGSGNYTRTHNFSADGSAGIKILASRMDAEFNDVASAMSLPVLRDGQNAPTANLPMGGFRHVNVGAPASATNYMRSKDFIENVPIYMVDAETSADRISVSAAFYTTASAATAPRDGSHILVKAGSDKSSAVAIRLNTGDGNPHSANVVLSNSSAIYSGAIRSGGIYEFIWSSSDTSWQIMNPQVDYANETYPGVILIATTAEAATGTNATKAITPQLLAAKFSASYATTASAGIVELATTAEVVARTNVSVVVTPAAMADFALTPYLAVVEIRNISASVVHTNSRASAWTVSVVGSGDYHIIHNIGLASAKELVIFTQIFNENDAERFVTRILDATASASVFRLDVDRVMLNASDAASASAPASCLVYIMAYRNN